MLFNVPVIPDECLIAFLNRNAPSFHSCHFSLHAPFVHDCRHRDRLVETDRWIDLLQTVRIPRKYLLMNSRAHGYGAYFDRDSLQTVAETLRTLLDASVIDGIIFADAYYLQALSDAAADVGSRLEAIPSVNCLLDSFDRIAAMIEFIGSTQFRLPGALVLDRSLNRRPDVLADVSARCRKTFPEIKLELIANEGCLDHCPFKLTHDCHISLLHMGQPLDMCRMNRDLGCMRMLQRDPALLFKSPFIRPEDLTTYEPTADVIKLCGRTLGAPFLLRVIDAYLRGQFTGNLLDLMDAMDGTAQWLHVENDRLPTDFLARMTSCAKACRTCSHCQDLLARCARPKPFDLEP